MNWRHYPFARVRDLHDGDTAEVEVDSGFGASHRVAVRVFGLSAPEVTGKERELGLAARRTARSVLHASADDAALDFPCELWTWKQSFNRYVGRIVLPGGLDFAREVLARGGGRAWDGQTIRPAFPVADVEAELVEYDRLLARDYRP